MIKKKIKIADNTIGEKLSRENIFKKINQIGKHLIAEYDIEKALNSAMDMAIELSFAERGMIILFEDEKKILFETARNINHADISNPEFEISKTIIDKAKKSGKNIFLRNALDDPLFHKSVSISKLKILSVICLPLQFNDNIFGVIYLDNRSVLGVFTEEIYDFVQEFADFISLAAYNSLKQKKIKIRVDELESELRGKYHFESIIGHHPKMIELLKLISQVSITEATVLIQGESGTGKELIARALHFNSQRKEKPFVPINCGAIPENLLESELFGHTRGAFTGALTDKIGWFERASGGTIFFDEVSEMSPALQVKLLRVLQSGEYNPVGSSEIHFTDLRIIAATNKDLKDRISNDKFRDDLFYRLNIIEIDLPPLKERKSDIPILIQHFLKIYSIKYKKENLFLTQETKNILNMYDYPGNVRELENIVQRAVALVEDEQIESKHLPPNINTAMKKISSKDGILNFKYARNNMLEKFELDYVTECMKTANGNISEAAKIAGIQYANFYKKVKKYEIKPSVYKSE